MSASSKKERKKLVLPVNLSASGAARAEAERVAALAKKEASDTLDVLKMPLGSKGSPSKVSAAPGSQTKDTPLSKVERLRRRTMSPTRKDDASPDRTLHKPSFASAVTAEDDKRAKELADAEKQTLADEAAAVQAATEASIAEHKAAHDEDVQRNAAVQAAKDAFIEDAQRDAAVQAAKDAFIAERMSAQDDEIQKLKLLVAYQNEQAEIVAEKRLEEFKEERQTIAALQRSVEIKKQEEEKLTSLKHDADADPSQSAGIGGGKPSSHHEESPTIHGSGDAIQHSSGKSSMEKAIPLPPAGAAADDTSHDDGGGFTTSFPTVNEGERRLMLQPEWSLVNLGALPEAIV